MKSPFETGTVPLCIVVVEDHPLMRESVARLAAATLDGEVVGQTGSCVEALALARRHRPGLMIIDVMLSDGNGLDLAQSLRNEFPEMRLAVVSSFQDAHYAARARQAGAHGYACKEASSEEFATMLRQVMSGAAAAGAPAGAVSTEPFSALTEREMAVFQLIGRGRATREIAAALGISFKTAEVHRENIKRKLGLGNSVALVQQATLWVGPGNQGNAIM